MKNNNETNTFKYESELFNILLYGYSFVYFFSPPVYSAYLG